MTRARDTLILTGNVPEKKFNKHWCEITEINTASLLAARNSLDWVAAWVAKTAGTPPLPPLPPGGENDFIRWTVYDDLDERLLDSRPRMADEEVEGPVVTLETGSWQKLYDRLDLQYPHAAATHEPANTSPSLLLSVCIDKRAPLSLGKFSLY